MSTCAVRAKIINGKAIAATLREGIAQRVRQLIESSGIVPGLAVIRVGDNPASALYVKNKVVACKAIGVHSTEHRLPAATTTERIVELIATLNAAPSVHGILVQLPLPSHIDMCLVLESISRHKDVDGFHLYNVGALVTGSTIFSPCTPYGVVKLLDHEGIPIAGQNIVVVGASNIVGKPMALMLMQRDATVCICHAKTRDLAQFTILADVLVVAAGRPGLILPQMVKTGAVVIDVGINRLPDGQIAGDVDFEGVRANNAGARGRWTHDRHDAPREHRRRGGKIDQVSRPMLSSPCGRMARAVPERCWPSPSRDLALAQQVLAWDDGGCSGRMSKVPSAGVWPPHLVDKTALEFGSSFCAPTADAPLWSPVVGRLRRAPLLRPTRQFLGAPRWDPEDGTAAFGGQLARELVSHSADETSYRRTPRRRAWIGEFPSTELAATLRVGAPRQSSLNHARAAAPE